MPCCLQRCTEFNIFANVIIVTNTDSNFALFIKKKKKKLLREQTLTLISRYSLKKKKLLREQTLTLLTALRAVTKI